MERRNFLKLLPLAAVSPQVVKDGVLAFNLPGPGHYVVVIDRTRVDIDDLMHEGILPAGSTGGYIIPVLGDADSAISFYKLDEKSDRI